MNCGRYEKRIALYVERDLSEGKARRLERHLAGCERCRDVLAELEASQAAVKSLGAEPVERAAYDQIRARVLQQIAAAPVRPAGRPWRWAWAAAAAAAIVAGWFALRPGQTPAPVRRPATEIARSNMPEPPQVVMPPPARPKPSARRVRRPAVRQRRPSAAPLVVKLETEDPNVVIYWIVDDTGD
jgi:hypothetical protein